VITVSQLRHSFTVRGEGTRQVLTGIDVAVADGEFVAIVGPSGCGKTTLLNVLAGLEPVQQGEVSVQGAAPKAGRHDIGYMLARDCLLPWRRALDNAALALEVQGLDVKTRRERAAAALASMGLANAGGRYPAQLSHGMRQRVALARVFAAAPDVILLDEPFSALDPQNRVLVQDAFLQVWERQRSTVVLITHDLGEAICLADRVIVMSASPGSVKSVYDVTLSRPRSASDLRGAPEFHQLYEAMWGDLRAEVERAAVTAYTAATGSGGTA
jgi:NitT/TauT family transport system ATP-binding protein